MQTVVSPASPWKGLLVIDAFCKANIEPPSTYLQITWKLENVTDYSLKRRGLSSRERDLMKLKCSKQEQSWQLYFAELRVVFLP